MSQNEILHEFRQLSIRQQLETLRAALEIVESNFDEALDDSGMQMAVSESAATEEIDPLLALAGAFHSSMTDIGENHDQYLGKNIKDDHA